MPYLDKRLTAKVRQELRSRFPEMKFSVRTKDAMAMNVTILEGPEWLAEDGAKETINTFHIDSFYEDEPKKRDFLETVASLMAQERYIESEDGDYGSIPSYYVHLSIGKWDKPYKVVS